MDEKNMATYSTYLPKGFVFRIKSTDLVKNTGLFDLEKFFRDMASRMGVSYRDKCCDSQVGFPIRLSDDKTTLQYFDPSNSTWTAFNKASIA